MSHTTDMSTPLPPYPNIPPQQAPYNAPLPPYMQQGFQPMPPPAFKPLPPKKSRTGVVLAVVGGIFTLGMIGVLVNPATQKGVQAGVETVRTSAPAAVSTVPVPAPVTVVVKETVTTGPVLSTNGRLLRLAWTSMAASDKADLKASWMKYKDNPALSDIFVDAFLSTMQESAPTLTRAEVIDFFRWVETQ